MCQNHWYNASHSHWHTETGDGDGDGDDDGGGGGGGGSSKRGPTPKEWRRWTLDEVRTLCVGVALPNRTVTRTFRLPGQRDQMRQMSVITALDLLRRELLADA
jgi:hypothetical protein